MCTNGACLCVLPVFLSVSVACFIRRRVMKANVDAVSKASLYAGEVVFVWLDWV